MNTSPRALRFVRPAVDPLTMRVGPDRADKLIIIHVCGQCAIHVKYVCLPDRLSDSPQLLQP